jgi:hypothetical protein
MPCGEVGDEAFSAVWRAENRDFAVIGQVADIEVVEFGTTSPSPRVFPQNV